MIDWIKITFPLPHAEPIAGGEVISFDSDGTVEWATRKRHHLPGSWDTRLSIRTATNTPYPCTHIELDGNPVKFIQGHNLWGTYDLPGLVLHTMHLVADLLGLPVSDETLASWRAGDVLLSRVDLTDSFHLANRAEVLSWLRAAEQTAHLPFRGRGQLTKNGTLYFGKHSRRWALKFYSKGDEIRAKGHTQAAIQDLPHALDWADKTLRAELCMRSMELKRRGLDKVTAWLVDDVNSQIQTMLFDVLRDVTMTTTRTLSDEVLAELTNAQKAFYLAWLAGNDLRAIMPKPSFYRLRAKLLPHGVDVATLMPKEVSNVVPLYRVLEAKPATIPDWAIGTPLYFEPTPLTQTA